MRYSDGGINLKGTQGNLHKTVSTSLIKYELNSSSESEDGGVEGAGQ